MQFSHEHEFKDFSSIRNLGYEGGGAFSNSTTNMESSTLTAEAKAVAACYRHSEAERRRRRRINDHLATLRTLLPNTIKTDKASLLAEVVRQVKELKKRTTELEGTSTDETDTAIRNYEYYMIPCETDELELTYIGEDPSSNTSMIKASLCCEDRPGLILEVTRALNSAAGKVVRAEIGTVGGRMKCVLWVQVSTITRDEKLQALQRALKVVVDKAAFLALPGNKRSRLSGCY